MPLMLYACKYCGKIYKSLPKAKKCEGQGKPEFLWGKGKKFISITGRVVVVVEQRVASHNGQHIAKYRLDWGGKPRLKSQSRMLTLIEKGELTPLV